MRPCLALAIAASLAGFVTVVDAQEGAPPAQQNQRQPMTLQEFIPVEGILGFLVFEQGISDEQLLDARDVLTTVHEGRQGVLEEMQAGTMTQETLRDTAFALRTEMANGLAAVLDDQQGQQLFQALGMQPPTGDDG